MLRPLVRPAVLALQGSVEPHHRALQRLGYLDAPLVRKPQQLENLTHLILPGGESTTFHKLLTLYGLWDIIRERALAGDLAILGTCAGAILLGRPSEERPPRWGLIDITVERNAYGTQLDSFVDTVELTHAIDLPGAPAATNTIQGIFIRAPRFREIGDNVEILGRLPSSGGEPVLVRQGRCVAATFHPELADEDRLHAWFLGV